MPSPQARYWLLTIPENQYTPTSLPAGLQYTRGQLEVAPSTGFRHWQLLVAYPKKVTLSRVKETYGSQCHAEMSRSSAADAYVWKEETSVEGTKFEFGRRAHRQNVSTDWDAIWLSAKSGDLEAVPSNIRVQHYRTLRCIASDYGSCPPMVRKCYLFWGVTGSGKSRLAWEQAGMDAYSKDPRTKFWDGYRDHRSVVLDEFRGAIDIAHLLRWLDRYPVRVEIKGSTTPLLMETIWITSNLHPKDWYPGLDEDTLNALLRRLEITHFSGFFNKS